MNRTFCIGSILLLFGCVQCSPGAVVYNNLGSTPYNADGYASYGLLSGTFYDAGMQFMPSETVKLSTLEVAIGQSFYNSSTQSGTAEIQLYSDVSNALGTPIETWVTSSPTPPNYVPELVTLTSVVTPTLHFGTKYWIVLTAAPGSNLGGAWYISGINTGLLLTDDGYAGGMQFYTQRSAGYRSEVIGSIPGDLNNDGVINQADVAIIQANNGKTISGGVSVGDLNGDGIVNNDDWALFDYDVAQYDVANPVTPAPEPGAVGLVGAMVVAFCYRRKH